jgi:hypothetical protein
MHKLFCNWWVKLEKTRLQQFFIYFTTWNASPKCVFHLQSRTLNPLNLLKITGTNIQVSIKGNDYEPVGKVVEKKKRY